MPRGLINRAATGRNLNHRNQTLRNLTGGPTGGIAPGDSPKGKTNIPGRPTGTNAQGYDPIRYGQNMQKWGYAKVGQARNQGGVTAPAGGAGGGAAGTPNHLSQAVRAALQEYGQSNIFGANAIPTNPNSTGTIMEDRAAAVAQMRRFLKNAQAAGVGNKGLMSFLDPTFYRGISDPYGGNRVLNWAGKNLTPEEFKATARFANTNTVARPGPNLAGQPGTQGLLFDAVPAFGDRYMQLANSYKMGPDTTNPMGTTPPGALLGSDGKWHDPEMPLPNGVTLDPASNPSAMPAERWWGGADSRFQGTGIFADDPNYMNNALNREGYTGAPANQATGAAAAGTPGAQNPATGPTSPQGTGGAGVASPQSAFDAGRDPAKHAAYWNDKGWHQNPATGVWHGPDGAKWDQTPAGKPGQGGGQGGPVNDPNGPQSPGAGGTGTTGNLNSMATGGPASQLPLDPTFEMGRAGAQSSLQNALSQINAQYGQLATQQALAQARMDTNREVDTQQLLENMAGRNTMQSSIYGDERGLLGTDYARQEQDLGISVADAMAQLAGAQGNAYTDYNSQLIQLLMDSAGRSNDQYAPVDQGPPAGRRRNNGRRGRRGNRGRGNR